MTALSRLMIVAFAAALLAGCANTKVAEPPSALGAAPTEHEKLAEASVDSVNAMVAPAEDDRTMGKKHYRNGEFGLAEKHFRAAVERDAGDAESWLGLAASYDELRRFDLADRAYDQVLRLKGPTVEIVNNQGYSYILRGDYKKARLKLKQAERKAPDNQYVKSNLALLASKAGAGERAPPPVLTAASPPPQSATQSASAQ